MVFLCSASGASAQAIYKQVDAEGRITYTDQPDSTPLARTATNPALDVANALASNSPISSRPAILIDASEAARRLEQAELERKRGAERLPGELAYGTDASVANLRYQQRQEELRRAVAQAQRRSGETSRALRVPL